MKQKLFFTFFLLFSICSQLIFLGTTDSLVYAQFDGDDFGTDPVDEDIALGNTDLRIIITNIINVALSLLGIILLIMILYSGFLWMTAGGNEERLSKARGTFFGAIIGLIIILASRSIVNFVIGAVAQNGGTNSIF